MKKLITICVGLIVAGCATTSQLEEIEKRLARIEGDTTIQDHEKRLARIEGDLYRVEVKSAPKAEKPEVKKPVEPKFVPAKEVEKNVVDTKVEAFLKEYFDVQFGDNIDKFPGKEERLYGDHSFKEIHVYKKFKYFDKARAHFQNGKLYAVVFYTEIDVKYSVDSTNEKTWQAFVDLVAMLGLEGNASEKSSSHKKLSSYGVFYINDWTLIDRWSFNRTDKVRRSGIGFMDGTLWKKLLEDRRQAEAEARRKKNATGDTLPDAE